MGIGKKYPRLLNEDRDEKAFSGGEQPVAIPKHSTYQLLKLVHAEFGRLDHLENERGHHFSLSLHFIDV
jgi:hypothetical protein